jgi:hypothetical protein
MRDAELKATVVSALRRDADFSGVRRLHDCRSQQHRRLLRWLDQSGLALYFLDRLQQNGAVDKLPPALREGLQQRLRSNRERTAAMFEEFRRLLSSLSDHGVPCCALKGLALIPDFCPDPHLRHQTDFDFLVPPEFFPDASRALRALGYSQQEVRETGEVTFATSLTHVPSAADDIYARPRHREVDLHPSLQLDFYGVPIHTPSDQLSRLRRKTIGNISFPTLHTDDAFSLQILHAFNHLLGSWIRLSWLFEISHFLDLHYSDSALWSTVIRRQGANEPDKSANRNAFGLILSLTQTLFRRPIPQDLDEWCVQPLPLPIQAWVRQLGQTFALAGLNGTKLTLFVHREFFSDRRAWRSYAFHRFFPFGRRSSIGSVSTASVGARIRANASQWLHFMRRSVFHLRELVFLPVHAVRWYRAVRAIPKSRFSDSLRPDSMPTGSATGNSMAPLARFRD